MLLPQLKRVDLWDKKEVENIDKLGNLISSLINEFKLNVGQSLSFYEIIKEDDEKEVKIDEVVPVEDGGKNEKRNKQKKKRKV